MSNADSDSYMYAFRDIVFNLVEEAQTDKRCDDPGYREAMFHVLGHIKIQAVTFELDLEYLGLASFDPERWYLRT